RCILDDVNKTNGNKDLVQFSSTKDRAETGAFDDNSNKDQDGERGRQQHVGVESGDGVKGKRDVRTKHEQFAMGKMDNLHHAEDEVQAGGEKNINASGIQSPDHDLDDQIAAYHHGSYLDLTTLKRERI